MNIIDVSIILIVLLGAVVGFKRGFTKELVSFVGFLLIVILAFTLKNPISIFLYENLPFFKFGGALKGVTVLNIALYELIAFLIVFAVLTFLFKIVLLASSIFEKILTLTIILGIPSKILGAILGAVEYFIYVFIGLYILSLPVFHLDIVNESKYRLPILNNTPILGNFASNTMNVFEEFKNLKEKYQGSEDSMSFNRDTLKLFLEYKIITVDSVEKLVEKDKLQIDDINSLLNEYREG